MEAALRRLEIAHLGAEAEPRREGDSMIDSDNGAVDPHFKVIHGKDGRFHWELINPHGTPAARSMETFATEDEAAANAEYARRLISRAPIQRP
jgi:hypothetical protein